LGLALKLGPASGVGDGGALAGPASTGLGGALDKPGTASLAVFQSEKASLRWAIELGVWEMEEGEVTVGFDVPAEMGCMLMLCSGACCPRLADECKTLGPACRVTPNY